MVVHLQGYIERFAHRLHGSGKDYRTRGQIHWSNVETVLVRKAVNLRDILRVGTVLCREFLPAQVGSLMRLDIAGPLQ